MSAENDEKLLGRSSHGDRKTRRKLYGWLPRLLDIHGAAAYCSVGAETIRGWVDVGLLDPVKLPGCARMRTKDGGHERIDPRRRNLDKILIDRTELDALIERQRGAA